MSKHNLSEKSNFTNLSEFLVRKKIIYLVALKYDHTVECLLLSNGQSKGWKSLQIHGIGYLLIHHFFCRTNDNLYSEEFLNKFTSSKKYKIFPNYLINN